MENPFEKYVNEYDDWFKKNEKLYLSELEAIKKFIPGKGKGIEIGVGTGKFSLPLNIKEGVEPSDNMAKKAIEKGIIVKKAFAESLPYKSGTLDFALMVTTVCFVNNIQKSFDEAFRILKEKGHFIIGFIDRESEIGRIYEKNKEKSKFYKPATFYTTDELVSYLKNSGFKSFQFAQTIFGMENKKYPIKKGYGEGSFVVICAKK